VDHRERVVTRDEVLRRIWEYNSEVTSRTIEVHIAWLRQNWSGILRIRSISRPSGAAVIASHPD
jgi:DNA-binding response OmpR family regulator